MGLLAQAIKNGAIKVETEENSVEETVVEVINTTVPSNSIPIKFPNRIIVWETSDIYGRRKFTHNVHSLGDNNWEETFDLQLGIAGELEYKFFSTWCGWLSVIIDCRIKDLTDDKTVEMCCELFWSEYMKLLIEYNPYKRDYSENFDRSLCILGVLPPAVISIIPKYIPKPLNIVDFGSL